MDVTMSVILKSVATADSNLENSVMTATLSLTIAVIMSACLLPAATVRDKAKRSVMMAMISTQTLVPTSAYFQLVVMDSCRQENNVTTET